MLNLTSTSITFYSYNIEQLDAFHSMLLLIGPGWLGKFVEKLLPQPPEDLHFSGEVEIISDLSQKTNFEIVCTEKWRPAIRMWELILKENFPDVKLVFISEGPVLYVNTDRYSLFYKDKYLLETEEEPWFFSTKKDLIETLYDFCSIRFKEEDTDDKINKELKSKKMRVKSYLTSWSKEKEV